MSCDIFQLQISGLTWKFLASWGIPDLDLAFKLLSALTGVRDEWDAAQHTPLSVFKKGIDLTYLLISLVV